MARGWESKSVEDQIGAAEAEKDMQATARLSLKEREAQQRKQSLLLSRAQVRSRYEAATNPRYRAQLKTALDYLEAQLSEFETKAIK